MITSHLTPWEQEEYLINPRAPQLVRHLSECAACRSAVERLEQGVTAFQRSAVDWSANTMASRPQPRLALSPGRLNPLAMRWALAGVIPVLLLLLVLVPFLLSKNARPDQSAPPISAAAAPAPSMSDDALLEQVDEQLSTAVPSPMESLTHLVSAQSPSGAGVTAQGSRQIVETN